MKYLKKEIFKPFFDENQQNQVYVQRRYFDVRVFKNGKNSWNQKDKNYRKRIKFYKEKLTEDDILEIVSMGIEISDSILDTFS